MRFFLLVMLLGALSANAQKIVRKSIINPATQTVLIDSEQCYEVHLRTGQGEGLKVEAEFEGEYQKDLLVNIEEEGSNILISTGFQPNFLHPNDKLSAHKIVSISLKIFLPEETKVRLFGKGSNVTVWGNYEQLQVSLADGDCTLNQVRSDALVKTQKGTIIANCERAQIQAESQFGAVYADKLPYGESVYTLHSVEGNIFVNRTD